MTKTPELKRQLDRQASKRPSSSFENSVGSNPVRVSVPGLGLLVNLARALPMLPMIIIFGVVLSFTVNGFMSLFSIQNILRQISVILIAATGETLVILFAGIDLSIGAVIGLGSVSGAYVMHATGSPLLGAVTCLAVGAVVGSINSVGIALVGIQPFIMTLATLLVAQASAFLVTGGGSIGGQPKIILAGGLLNIVGLPLAFILGISVAVAGAFVLGYTAFGQKIYMAGSNPRAAAFSGVDIKRLTFLIYLICGTLGGVASFVFIMRLGVGAPDAGIPLLLPIIGAVLLGGNAMTGGEGGMLRTITGALLIAMIMQSMQIAGAQFWDQLIVVGILVVLGTALGGWLGRRRTSESRGRIDAPPGQKGSGLSKAGAPER